MRITLKTKLGLAFAILVLLSAAGMFLGINNMGKMNETYDDLIDNKIKRIRNANLVDASAVRIARDMREIILADSIEEIDRIAASNEENRVKVDTLLAEMYELAGPEGRAAIDAFREPWAQYLESNKKVREQARKQSIRKARRLVQNEGREAYEATYVVWEHLLDDLRIAMDQSDAKADSDRYIAVADIEPIMLGIRGSLLNILASADNPERQQSISKNTDARIADLKAQLDKVDSRLRGADKERFAEVKSKVADWLTVLNRARALGLENGDYYAAEATKAADEYRRQADALADQLVNRLRDEINQGQADATASYENSRTILIGALIIITLIAMAAATWIVLNLSRAITSALGLANSVAAGDLNATASVNSNDEIKDLIDALNQMVARLRGIVGEVRSTADTLGSASEEVSATAQNLSQASSEQAASVEETSSSVEQMAASINQNTENAKVTNDMSAQAASQAVEGGQAVGETVEAMKQIADKISIIDDIAYQTNLLALNAAIEAARAGEHGKGFAVVAAEVRKLAERSQVAAQEIGETAKGSVSLAEKAGKLLDEIVPGITKTSELVQEITAASTEQASGASQINTAMEQLNQITQQNASSSEELASTSEEMSSQAQQLQELMAFFKVDDSDVPTGQLKSVSSFKKPDLVSPKATANETVALESGFVKF